VKKDREKEVFATLDKLMVEGWSSTFTKSFESAFDRLPRFEMILVDPQAEADKDVLAGDERVSLERNPFIRRRCI
jgi:hypothetical protein